MFYLGKVVQAHTQLADGHDLVGDLIENLSFGDQAVGLCDFRILQRQVDLFNRFRQLSLFPVGSRLYALKAFFLFQSLLTVLVGLRTSLPEGLKSVFFIVDSLFIFSMF